MFFFRSFYLRILIVTVLFAGSVMSCSDTGHGTLPASDPDNGGLFLADGFEAAVILDSLKGAARHLAVNSNGDVYVKVKLPDSLGANAALRDTNNDGRIDIIEYFGNYIDKSGGYGTEMRIRNGYLWFSSVLEIYRQKLTPGKLVPETELELMLTDTQPPRQHDTKPIAFDNDGNMYVPFGAPSDCCQEVDREPFSPGIFPCPLLETRAGIWKFDANKPNQFQWEGEKYATGVRSVVGMSWDDQSNSLFALDHGRDYLHRGWSNLYSRWEGAVLPSEEFLRLEKGSDAGWPYYYHDHLKGKRMLNPEYGGDGKKEGEGEKYTQPVIGFPGHFAPNDLLFYRGTQFPERYKNGAFIAFHGSTSSAPYPQAGYFVAFVPMKNGEPTGPWEVFADGFAVVDPVLNVSDAVYRPMGLAEGPDGSLYIADSNKGKIWRIMFKGNKRSFGARELAKMDERKKTASNIKLPDEVKDNLAMNENLPEGTKLYNLHCAACHQYDGKGAGSRFPPVARSEWVSGNKDTLIDIILNGMEGPIKVGRRMYDGLMPPFKDVLSDDETSKILSYIRQNFYNNSSEITTEEVKKVRQQTAKKAK